MAKSTFNLASSPRVNLKKSRMRMGAALLLGLIMAAAGGWRLDDFMTRQGSLRQEAAALRTRQDEAQERLQKAEKIIVGQQKIWKDRIDWANGLLKSSAPLLSHRLEQLETILPGPVRLDHLSFERREGKTLSLTVVASGEDDLYEMYRRLAGSELKVSSESALRNGGIKATLSLTFADLEEGTK